MVLERWIISWGRGLLKIRQPYDESAFCIFFCFGLRGFGETTTNAFAKPKESALRTSFAYLFKHIFLIWQSVTQHFLDITIITPPPPKTNMSTKNWWLVGRWNFLLGPGPFSEAMLVFQGVYRFTNPRHSMYGIFIYNFCTIQIKIDSWR